MPEQKMPLTEDADIVAAWKAALALGRQVGFGLFKQACLSGAVLELCRNVVERGGPGYCTLSDLSDGTALRARVVVEGCSPDLVTQGRGKNSREICVGPALPAVKLHQVVETLSAESCQAGARLTLTIHQGRPAVKPQSRRPVVSADRRVQRQSCQRKMPLAKETIPPLGSAAWP